MFGVAAAHFGADERPGAAPEAGEVAGDLDGAACRGEQFEAQRHTFFADGWVGIDAVKFLNNDRQGGLFCRVVDAEAAA